MELGEGDSPFAREAAAGPPECPAAEGRAPGNVVALADVPSDPRRPGPLAPAGPPERAATGLNHVVLSRGGAGRARALPLPEEELFVVLDGDGVLELWPRERGGPGGASAEARRRGLASGGQRGGSHALRPGEHGLTYLAYGTREHR